jgi:hypothetical protein
MQSTLVKESENDRVIEGERELIADILAGNHERYYELIAPIERRVYYTAYAILGPRLMPKKSRKRRF